MGNPRFGIAGRVRRLSRFSYTGDRAEEIAKTCASADGIRAHPATPGALVLNSKMFVVRRK